MPVKTAVLVSGGGTNLQAIIDAQAAGELPQVALTLCVSNNEGAYALTRAKNAGMETAYIARGAGFEEALSRLLAKKGIEVVVLAGFMTILSEGFTANWERRMINVHPSLIPSFCGKGYYGLRVHEAALSYGVKVTGATVHYVNAEPDGGEIIMQRAVEVLPSDTPETLQRRVMEQAEWTLLPRALELVCERIAEEKDERVI